MYSRTTVLHRGVCPNDSSITLIINTDDRGEICQVENALIFLDLFPKDISTQKISWGFYTFFFFVIIWWIFEDDENKEGGKE